jgi:ComF family protein
LIKDFIHRFKFERAQAAAKPIATMMAGTLPYFDRSTIVTHIPTATSRRRQRGYDHAALLARALAQRLGLRHMTLLARLGQTRQVGATRGERLKQLHSAFRPLRTSVLPGSRILVVDDIVTTGATLEAAAHVLRENGAKTVSAAVFAQKR